MPAPRAGFRSPDFAASPANGLYLQLRRNDAIPESNEAGE